MGTIVLIFLLVLLLGGGGFGYQRWGYAGGVGLGGPLLLILIILLLMGYAHAAEVAPVVIAPAGGVDFTAIAITVIGGIFAVIKIVAESYAASRIKDVDARAIVDKALDNSLGAIQQAAQGEVLAIKPVVAIPGVGAALAPGVQYVLDHAGPEAERLGITPVALADKIDARLGLANIATNLAVSASPAPVIAKPLDPVPGALPAAA